MYVSLSNVGNSSNAFTSDQKYPCVSLAQSSRFFPYYQTPATLQYHSPSLSLQPSPYIMNTLTVEPSSFLTTDRMEITDDEGTTTLSAPIQAQTSPYNVSIPQTRLSSKNHIEPKSPLHTQTTQRTVSTEIPRTIASYQYTPNHSIQTSSPSSSSSPVSTTSTENIKESFDSRVNATSPSSSPYNPYVEIKDKHLLPVLKSQFNLREICKQCILLEDHLSHKEKRCMDCCVKHFLALEGLSEEAITLDSTTSYPSPHCDTLMESLPTEIREIQSFWYQNPDKHAQQAAQKLRTLRKRYQTDVFDFIFKSSSKCDGNSCSI